MTLQRLVRVTPEARLLRRCQALLWRAAGESIPTIAGRLGVSRQTVHNWATQFLTRSDPVAERLAAAERSGRPATAQGIIDPLIAALIDGDPRLHGYAVTTWTAPLLQKHLAESAYAGPFTAWADCGSVLATASRFARLRGAKQKGASNGLA